MILHNINNQNKKNISYDINNFYKNFKGTNFKGITAKKILEIRILSKYFNNYFNNDDILDKTIKYTIIMNNIKSRKNQLKLNNEAEKYILLMYSVDPTFEAFKIYGECNKIDEIKEKMKKYLGIYDQNLILIEKHFIKSFLSENKQNEINEEIENRIYKI